MQDISLLSADYQKFQINKFVNLKDKLERKVTYYTKKVHRNVDNAFITPYSQELNSFIHACLEPLSWKYYIQTNFYQRYESLFERHKSTMSALLNEILKLQKTKADVIFTTEKHLKMELVSNNLLIRLYGSL